MNIKNGETGILFNTSTDLNEILISVCTNPERFINIGLASKNYYENFRTPKHMADGISSAIEHTK